MVISDKEISGKRRFACLTGTEEYMQQAAKNVEEMKNFEKYIGY